MRSKELPPHCSRHRLPPYRRRQLAASLDRAGSRLYAIEYKLEGTPDAVGPDKSAADLIGDAVNAIDRAVALLDPDHHEEEE